jgi:hypothetical protein
MKHATDVTVILDRSGSMQTIASDVIGGFNAQPIAEAPRLTIDNFKPRGRTALLDAIGRTIDSTGARLAALLEQDRPDHVLLVIITDGLENASTDFKVGRPQPPGCREQWSVPMSEAPSRRWRHTPSSRSSP